MALNNSSLPRGINTVELSMLKNWQEERKVHSTEEYLITRKVIINSFPNKDLITCYFCGFPDGVFLELHHLDGDHSNYSPSNLVLACSCCHKLHHLGWVATENLGRLSYIPQNRPVVQQAKADNKNQLPLLELINLFQFYKLVQNLYKPKDVKKARNQSLNSQPIGGLFNETRMLVNSSGMANNYATQLAYEYKKKALLKKRQELAQIEEELKKQQGQASTQAQQDASTLDAAHTQLQNQKKQVEEQIEAGEKEIDAIENASTSDQLEDVAEQIKKELLSDFKSYAAGSLHLLDVLEMLEILNYEHEKKRANNDGSNQDDMKTTPTDLFFAAQKNAVQNGLGFFTIEFNPSIFEPWHKGLGYTFQERIEFYTNKLGITTPGLSETSLDTLMERIERLGGFNPMQDQQKIIQDIAAQRKSERAEVGNGSH